MSIEKSGWGMDIGLTCSSVADDELVVFDGNRGHANDGERISSVRLWLLGRRWA